MLKFRNLKQGEKYAHKNGEYLWSWLNELYSYCEDDNEFKSQIKQYFRNPKGVYEYWEKGYQEHRNWDTKFRNPYSRERKNNKAVRILTLSAKASTFKTKRNLNAKKTRTFV